MKMPYLKTTVLAICLLTSLSVVAAPAKSVKAKNSNDEVDLNLSHSIVQQLINQVLNLEDQIEWVVPTFDQKLSSIRNERIVYSVSSSVKNLPWSNRGAKVTASSDFSTDRTSALTGIKSTSRASISADVLSMVRHTAKAAIKDTEPGTGRYRDAHRLITTLTEVKSMEVFHQVLTESQDITKREIVAEINNNQKRIDCMYRMECGNITVDQWGNRGIDYYGIEASRYKIETLRRLLAAFQSMTIAITGDRSMDTITVTNADGIFENSYKDAVYPYSATINFTPDELSVGFSAFAELSIADLDKMHGKIVNKLSELNEGSTYRRDLFERGLRTALAEFKMAVNNTFSKNKPSTSR